jgi:hypothetical protein
LAGCADAAVKALNLTYLEAADGVRRVGPQAFYGEVYDGVAKVADRVMMRRRVGVESRGGAKAQRSA